MATAQTLKGFRDFLPPVMAIRNQVISTFRQVFESYGFSELQTPTLEYADVLLGKYGEEAEKLMYLFKDRGNRDVGLKYDLTVPLARVMAQYPDIPKPFKRYQIQPVFRADNTQKGRYREIYQCDFDIVGTESPIADAEIPAIISDCLTNLKFSDFTIRINSRQILFDIIIKANIPSNLSLTVLQSVDKLDKKSTDEVSEELMQKGLSKIQVLDLFSYLKSAEPDTNLSEIIKLSEALGTKHLKFDPTLVRGLDYYTGAIYETVVKEPKIGSVSGGGRYDHLIENLGGPNLPAVGSTIGLDRIVDVITELKLHSENTNSTKALVTIFSPNLVSQSLNLSVNLRSLGINVELFPDPNIKLDKQLKYASQKNTPYVVIVGPEEIAKHAVILKNMSTGQQVEVSPDKLASQLLG